MTSNSKRGGSGKGQGRKPTQSMGDCNLLMLAAKAANINPASLPGNAHFSDPQDDWNPLKNDGQAMRLAVHLGIGVSFGKRGKNVVANPNNFTGPILESKEPDLYAAVRRAIVRAAARIGEHMEAQN